MSRVLSLLLLLLFVPARGDQASVSGTLRVLTYNIHHGEGTDGVFDLTRIAGIVKSARPDLVALQEVDQGTARAGGVYQLEELARLTGLHAEFGKAMDFMGGGYGVAVMSRWPLSRPHIQPLPGAADREPRTALTVQVKPGDDAPRLQFTSTHLDQGRDEQNRLAQAEFLRGLDVGLPALLAGDMNSRADTAVMKTLETRWTNAFDFGLSLAIDGRPRFRGDYVLFQPADSWRVLEATVIDDRVASDHRPVLAVLEWSGAR
jgi:endonuclease/exonuclease/phosphatase family metal-dependent hydrolase